jgi:hypothetical protein
MNWAVVIMMNNYVHDLATGLLFGSVAAYFLSAGVVRRADGLSEREQTALQLWLRFRPVVRGALAMVLLGGIPRMIFYEDYEWLPAAGRGQILALVIKHIFLVGITVGSIVFFFKRRPKPATSQEPH